MRSNLNTPGNLCLAVIRLVLVAGMALLAGCSVLRAPKQVVTSVVPGNKSETSDPLQLQVQLEKYTDDFNIQMAQALADYAKKAGTESARREALQLKLWCTTAVTSIASGPNPNASLLDLVSVAMLGRISIEDRWIKAGKDPVYDQWVTTSRSLEATAWQLAASVLKPEFVTELRQRIEQWSAENPGVGGTFLVRPLDFTSTTGDKKRAQVNLNSVLSLVNLDPTASLDPAVREITNTRLLAERAMFTAQRMPFILRLQTELLVWELTDQPELRQVLTNATLLADSADRISRASESAGRTIAELPDRLATERKEILASLDQQEGKLKDLGVQIDRTLQSAEKMSASLNTTIGTFDLLMKRFGVGDPATGPPPGTNSAPFNILDYGQVADRVGVMAKDVDALVNSVNQSVPQLERLSHSATGDARKLVDRGFRLGLVLVLALLVGGVLAGLVFQLLSEKLKRPALRKLVSDESILRSR